jgi:hypothetical protein
MQILALENQLVVIKNVSPDGRTTGQRTVAAAHCLLTPWCTVHRPVLEELARDVGCNLDGLARLLAAGTSVAFSGSSLGSLGQR